LRSADGRQTEIDEFGAVWAIVVHPDERVRDGVRVAERR
jgi:hypothetical protein